MAGTSKKFSPFRIELPAETAAALKRWAELLPPETVAGLKRLFERHCRLRTPDLKRLLRHLSPEEREVLDEIERRRRELIKKVRQLQQLEEQLDHELGGRWWDSEGGFLVLPMPSEKVTPAPAPFVSRAAVLKLEDPPAPANKVTRQEWWDAFLTPERKKELGAKFKDITTASRAIRSLMEKEEATIDGGAYGCRHIENLLRKARVFPPVPRRQTQR
jgi:hypothetical protein